MYFSLRKEKSRARALKDPEKKKEKEMPNRKRLKFQLKHDTERRQGGTGSRRRFIQLMGPEHISF